MADPTSGGKKQVPIYCYQCVSGPDLMKVEVENGVATRIESNWDIRSQHPGGGRVCVKAYGLIQKTYNPNRVKQPMKRTNPKKGRDEDPGFVPISWAEAFEIVGAKLRELRAKGLTDESGFPRLAVSSGGGGTPVQYMGTFPAFMAAWGPVDQGFGAGQGVKCYHSEHLYGELWHRAFIVSPDTPYVNYIINCGNNVEASGGVAGVWREADARVRGAKRVQVEPHLSITGAVSAEWVPIRPKTDAAFLFGLIHHILHERKWEEVCDLPYLRQRTNSPYLIGPNGWFLRDAASEKPLIWDRAEGKAKPYDAAIVEPALAGNYQGIGHRDRAGRCALEPRGRRGATRVPENARSHARVQSGLGGGGMRRAGCDHPPHRRRIRRGCLHRPDHRDRRAHPALPPGRGHARQGRMQRLGRVPVRVVAENPRHSDGRARSAGRHARYRGQAGAPCGVARRLGTARGRWLHAIPVQRDLGLGLDEAPAHPQRLQDTGAAGVGFALVAGARAFPPALAFPQAPAGALAAHHGARRLVLLPHQPGNLFMERAGGGQSPGGVPLHRRLRLYRR